MTGTVGTDNPVDAGAGVDPNGLAAIAGEILASDEVDALLVILVATGVTDTVAALTALAEARTAHPDTPVLLVPMGGLIVPPEVAATMATYRSTGAAVRALARAVRYATWRSAPRAQADRSDPSVIADVRGIGRGLIADLTVAGQRDVLPRLRRCRPAALGVRSETRPASSSTHPRPRRTPRTGSGTRSPSRSPTGEVVHKTERRLVRVGLTSEEEVVEAFRDFQQELGRKKVDVLVQPIATGTELALGIVRDPVFGPLVMVAAGGVATEVWDDRIFLMPPVTRTDATRVDPRAAHLAAAGGLPGRRGR